MEDPAESAKRLEMNVKRVSNVALAGEPSPQPSQVSQDVDYVGSMVGREDGFPTGMRHRIVEPPLGRRIGYHELEDEKEEADEDWMTGEASQLSGGGTRGSSNWVLKVMFPILLIVGIVLMHNWWTDIKKHASNAANAVGDVFDRRALTEVGEEAGPMPGRITSKEGRPEDVSDKAVYSVHVEERDAGANSEA